MDRASYRHRGYHGRFYQIRGVYRVDCAFRRAKNTGKSILEIFENNGKTRVVWTFGSATHYPLGRLAILFMRKPLRQQYERGLENLKQHLERSGASLSSLSAITLVNMPEMNAMVASASGKRDELTSGYTALFAKAVKAVTTRISKYRRTLQLRFRL